jgi:hypothetical protein
MLEKIQSILYISFLLILIWQLVFSENSLLGKQEAMFEIDGNTYIISNMGTSKKSDPANLKNVGTRISCDLLKDITGQQIISDAGITGTKSFISGDKLSVDCIEPYSGIAIDYLSKDFYSFKNGGPNKDVYEFYDRVALNEYKKENLINGGINYVNIPYTVDHCAKNKNGDYVCDDNPSISVRKQRIKTYLDSKINDIL